MKTAVVLLPTASDRKYLTAERCGRFGLAPEFVEFNGAISDFRVIDFLRDVEAGFFSKNDVGAIIGTADYPSVQLASWLAERHGIDATPFRDILRVSHKHRSRIDQRLLTPEHVPDFTLWDGDADRPAPIVTFPCFAKPVKGVASWFCEKIGDENALREYARRFRRKAPAMLGPFSDMLAMDGTVQDSADGILLEHVITGAQVTVDCMVQDGEASVIGIVDSLMYPGTSSFRAFRYPSTLPSGVLDRMTALARRIVAHSGLRWTLCNLELFYDDATDRIWIIELNPRMSSGFADLYEKVDGFNLYDLQLQLAQGIAPTFVRGQGAHACAANFIPRIFKDMRVARIPNAADIAAAVAPYPDAEIELLCDQGRLLSDYVQDPYSYRYAFINVGGHDFASAETAARRIEKTLGFAFDAPAKRI